MAFAVTFIIANQLGATATNMYGPALVIWVCHLCFIAGLLLTGSPPSFFPHAMSMQAVYAAYILVALGVGASFPATMPLFDMCLHEVGLDKEGTAASLAVIATWPFLLAQTVAPLFTGALVQTSGVATTGSIFFGLACFSFFITLCVHSKFIGVVYGADEKKEEEPMKGEAKGESA
jgi:MFS family permease